MALKYSIEDIKNDIVRVKGLVNKIPTQNDYKIHGVISINTILNKNPWRIWLKELFNETNREFVNNGNGLKVLDEDLIDNLRDLAEKLGRAPLKEELYLGKYSYNTYVRAFGSFSKSLKKINLLPKIQFGLSEQEMLNDIKRVYGELERTPSFNEFTKLSNTVTATTVLTKFGSWNKALIYAGIPVSYNKNVTKDEVILALQKWMEENKNDEGCLSYWSIRQASKDDRFPYSPITISNRFDNKSWEEIMQECGYNYETVDQFYSKGSFNGIDGQVYLSLLEQMVGNFLFELKNNGKIKEYQYEKLVCNDRKWTCDFVVIKNDESNIWVETDGMLNYRKYPYLSGENEKVEYYKNNGYDYFIITYKMSNITKELSNKLFGKEE